ESDTEIHGATDGTNVDAKTLGKEKLEETLGKSTAGTTDGVNTRVSHTGDVPDNVTANTSAKFWSDDEDDRAPENEPPENVVPETPKADVRSEKQKTPENVMHSNASDTNTVVNSQSEESMKTVSENFDDAPTEKHTGGNNNVIDLEDDAGSKEKYVEDVPVTNRSKRLRSNSGKGVATSSQKTNTPSKGKKNSTPAKKPVNFGPPRSASKVNVSSAKGKKSSKRKEPLSSDSEIEEEAVKVTTGGSSRKTVKGKKVPLNVPPAPLDNVSFHFEDGSTKWRYVFYRRLSLEKNLSPELLQCQELVSLIEAIGLIKTVKDLGNCYEKLVKEFLINIGEDCNDPENPEFGKVFVRGRCTNFSPAVVNKFLGRSAETAPAMQVSNDEIFKTLTNNQVRKWSGNIQSAKLTAKYALLNKIGVINWVPTRQNSEVSIGMAKFIYAIGTSCNDPKFNIRHLVILLSDK
ncbi:envelope-like protein, partial [Trifolium medium]|nr:envelope-like protein [Trifolium medium]